MSAQKSSVGTQQFGHKTSGLKQTNFKPCRINFRLSAAARVPVEGQLLRDRR